MADPAIPAAVTKRREAHERALGLLYEAESKRVDLAEMLGTLPLAPDPFAEELCRGVDAHVGEFDALLGELSTTWSPERMPTIDRLVLRLGLFELMYRPEVPTGVVLSEWVEIAGEYSTVESSRFVNGILARVTTTIEAKREYRAARREPQRARRRSVSTEPHGASHSEPEGEA